MSKKETILLCDHCSDFHRRKFLKFELKSNGKNLRAIISVTRRSCFNCLLATGMFLRKRPYYITFKKTYHNQVRFKQQLIPHNAEHSFIKNI